MKGILFKPWKIIYIAEHPDIEIQTRRVIKPQPPAGASIWLIENANTGESHFSVRRCNPWYTIKPRYQVGETVYIKEAWKVDKKYDTLKPSELPSGLPLVYPFGGDPADEIPIPDCYGRLRSPLHLREEDARYFRTITGVRAERLQGISPQDVRREGINPLRTDFDQPINRYEQIDREEFIKLWNSINKDYPWESNPWVFPYSFKRI